MITSILDKILALPERTSESLQVYLNSAGITIFDSIFRISTGQEAQYIVLYILYAYSQESPLVIIHSNSQLEKEGICAKLDMPEYIREWVLKLPKDKYEINEAIVDYIEYFAGAEWRALQMLKVQYDNLERLVATQDFKDEKGMFNFDQQMKATTQLGRLAGMIDKMDKDIKQRSPHIHLGLRDAIGKNGKKQTTKRRGGSVENSEFIK